MYIFYIYIYIVYNLKANTYFFCFPGDKKKCLSPTSIPIAYLELNSIRDIASAFE